MVNIVFDGVMTDCHVKINGQVVGPDHQGSFYRFRYDISSLLKYGETNRLEMHVKKWSDNPSVNLAERKADYWIFGGVFRPVWLEALPAEHIERIAIDAKADGSFSIDVFLEGIKKAKTVEAQITTLAGEPVGKPFIAKVSQGNSKVNLLTQIKEPALWTSETPNRYQVQIRLKAGENLQHEIIEKFGFRTIEIKKGNGVYVNGVKVLFKGVNRHSFWPTTGRTTNKKLSIDDVNLIKDMNMNAVRMSHYPPDVHFLDVCDSLGLFVIDELAGWQACYDSIVGRKLVKEMVIRDVNHPSIVFWANGNEGGWNRALDKDYAWYDPQQF
jgi:beta-galactosidase/beta-glucuronidase